MSQGFPAFPDDVRPPEDFDSGLERLGDLEELLEAAENAGVVDEPAADPSAARANQVQAPVIAECLHLLGYLKDEKDNGLSADKASRRRYCAAVERFQRDAGLKADQWVGDKTCRALRRLVTFETPTGMEAFLRDGRAGPALARAVRLRLYALGVSQRAPHGGAASDRLPVRELARFWELSTYLGFEEGQPPDELGLIQRVFDHDRIVIGISNTPRIESESEKKIEGFRLVGSAGTPLTAAARELVQRFLVSVAKVELWLLGFDVDIDRRLDYPVLGVRIVTPRSKRFRRALREFWRELAGRPEEWSKKMVRFVTPALFQALARIETEHQVGDSTAAASGDESRAVLASVGTRGRAIERAWSRGKGLGMRLWDGMKRVWRWILRGVKRILRIGRNLARAFFAYANKAFRIARFAVRTAGKALGQYLGAQIHTGVDNPVTVRLAGDGDILVLIPTVASTADVERAAWSTTYFGVAFDFATRVLTALLNAISAATGALSANVIGWARLVWILVRSYRELRPSWRSLRDVAMPEGW